MNLQKHQLEDAKKIIRHNLRICNGHKNKNIDETRTPHNLSYNGEGSPSKTLIKRYAAFDYNYQLKNGKHMKKDTVAMCSWVVTLPWDVAEGDELKFFDAIVAHFRSVYGIENEISAVIHVDEGRIHLHYDFMPAIDDRLCARDRITKRHLCKAHEYAQKAVEEALGYKVSILTNEAEKLTDKDAHRVAEYIKTNYPEQYKIAYNAVKSMHREHSRA